MSSRTCSSQRKERLGFTLGRYEWSMVERATEQAKHMLPAASVTGVRSASQATAEMPELFSARAAALTLGYARRTAAIRAQRAYEAGDRRVSKARNNLWLAPLSWWEELLADPPQRGYRPARHTDSA